MIGNELLSVQETQALIGTGSPLLLAGDSAVLAHLDRGNWIGGSIPYFMTRSGGTENADSVFVTQLPDTMAIHAMRFYDAHTLPSVNADGISGGISFIIIPYESEAHARFAVNAPSYDRYLMHPLIGWISGTALADIGKVNPAVFLGHTGEKSHNDAVVMHCRLPDPVKPNIDILNVFEQNPSGDSIRFQTTGFSVKTALVNGEEQSFCRYLQERGIDTRLPLVSSYYGAMINLSFQHVDNDNDLVTFYSPVAPNREYRIARAVDDYAEALRHISPTDVDNAVFSCNCILNYQYGKLEGKRVGNLFGPITFGEIAYQLVNQTLVFATLETPDRPSKYFGAPTTR